MKTHEFNKRCHDVFVSRDGDFYFNLEIDNDRVKINMAEYDADMKCHVPFVYEPDMTNRPEALDYLLGKRNDFND